MNSTHTSTDAYRRLSRRHFTQDFKRSVVEHLLSNELTVAEVASEYKLHPNQLCRWRNEYRSQQLETTPTKYQATSFLPVTVTEQSLANQKMTIDEPEPRRCANLYPNICLAISRSTCHRRAAAPIVVAPGNVLAKM